FTPILASDANSTTEDAVDPILGNVLDNDVDPTGFGALAVEGDPTRTGTYGALEIAADGTYSYRVDNAKVQALAPGESVVDTFELTVTNASPIGSGSATTTLQITINACADAPG